MEASTSISSRTTSSALADFFVRMDEESNAMAFASLVELGCEPTRGFAWTGLEEEVRAVEFEVLAVRGL